MNGINYSMGLKLCSISLVCPSFWCMFLFIPLNYMRHPSWEDIKVLTEIPLLSWKFPAEIFQFKITLRILSNENVCSLKILNFSFYVFFLSLFLFRFRFHFLFFPFFIFYFSFCIYFHHLVYLYVCMFWFPIDFEARLLVKVGGNWKSGSARRLALDDPSKEWPRGISERVLSEWILHPPLSVLRLEM